MRTSISVNMRDFIKFIMGLSGIVAILSAISGLFIIGLEILGLIDPGVFRYVIGSLAISMGILMLNIFIVSVMDAWPK